MTAEATFFSIDLPLLYGHSLGCRRVIIMRTAIAWWPWLQRNKSCVFCLPLEYHWCKTLLQWACRSIKAEAIVSGSVPFILPLLYHGSKILLNLCFYISPTVILHGKDFVPFYLQILYSRGKIQFVSFDWHCDSAETKFLNLKSLCILLSPVLPRASLLPLSGVRVPAVPRRGIPPSLRS